MCINAFKGGFQSNFIHNYKYLAASSSARINSSIVSSKTSYSHQKQIIHIYYTRLSINSCIFSHKLNLHSWQGQVGLTRYPTRNSCNGDSHHLQHITTIEMESKQDTKFLYRRTGTINFIIITSHKIICLLCPPMRGSTHMTCFHEGYVF